MKVIDKIKVDCNSYLRDIENVLRTNIQFILKDKYGDSWEEHLGVSKDRIKKWEERKEEERNRLNGKVLENRLLFYSDFYYLFRCFYFLLYIKKYWIKDMQNLKKKSPHLFYIKQTEILI